jgi:DNA-directed RNA polymerase beta subunit
MRQAVPLVRPEAPVVGTGMERNYEISLIFLCILH